MLNKVLKSAEIDEIIDYIGDNFKAVPYLYVNVLKYGSGTDSVTTWIDRNENGNMEGVYLLYYDCIHFYTNNMDIYPAKQLTEFVRSTNHRVIMLQGGIGDRLDNYFSDY